MHKGVGEGFFRDSWELRHRDQEDHGKFEAQERGGYVRDQAKSSELGEGKFCGKSNIILNTE